MKSAWTFGIATVLMALLCCGSALADCHGDCHEDDSCCSAACCHVCRCATVQVCGIDFDPTFADLTTGGTAYLPSAATTDIFRPPNSV